MMPILVKAMYAKALYILLNQRLSRACIVHLVIKRTNY
jgi:hypothetical protein